VREHERARAAKIAQEEQDTELRAD
jgi:hypothetical protein